jgi:hypothetical protein
MGCGSTKSYIAPWENNSCYGIGKGRGKYTISASLKNVIRGILP